MCVCDLNEESLSIAQLKRIFTGRLSFIFGLKQWRLIQIRIQSQLQWGVAAPHGHQ